MRSNPNTRWFKFVEPSWDGSNANTNFPGDIDAAYVGADHDAVYGNVQDFSLPSATATGVPGYQSPIYTSAQVKVTLAEGKLKGWNVGTGTTASLFKERIEDSMSFWGVEQTDIDAYTAAHTNSKTCKSPSIEQFSLEGIASPIFNINNWVPYSATS